MKMPTKLKSAIPAIVIIIVLVSTAYLAAGGLYDRLVPESPIATVTLVQVETNGLGGTGEHEPLPGSVMNGGEYDLGVRVLGLKDRENVRTMFSLTHSGISVDDVYAYFYDEISHTWRPLIMVDKGNSLVGVLGPTAGQDIYEGFEDLTLIIVITHFDGACKADCWVEIAK